MCLVFKTRLNAGNLLSAEVDSFYLLMTRDGSFLCSEMEKCGFAHMINLEKTSVMYLTVFGWSVSYAMRIESLCLRTLSVIIWAVMTEFWLISAPGEKTCQQTWDKMNMATTQTNLSTNHKFNIPELKVNDSLFSISVKALVYFKHIFDIFHLSNEIWGCFSTGGNSGCPCWAVRWACQIGLFRREVSCLRLTFYQSV